MNLRTELRQGQKVRSRDIDWFVPLTLIASLEMVAAGPARTWRLFPGYLLVAEAAAALFAFAFAVIVVVTLVRRGEQRPVAQLLQSGWNSRSRIMFIAAGLVLASVSASAVTALKAGITTLVPFYADPELAKIDQIIFGDDAWRWTHSLFGWASGPVSLAYATWMFGQVATYTALLFSSPSRLKSQAILAHLIMWLILGIILAHLLSSAGPIFYDQIYGGRHFSGLAAFLGQNGLTAEAQQYLWRSYQGGTLQFASGISAMPSMHVAGATWLALVTGTAFPRWKPFAVFYVALIYLGSLMTGWHYGLDGIVGAAGAWIVWRLAAHAANWRSRLAWTIGARQIAANA